MHPTRPSQCKGVSKYWKNPMRALVNCKLFIPIIPTNHIIPGRMVYQLLTRVDPY